MWRSSRQTGPQITFLEVGHFFKKAFKWCENVVEIHGSVHRNYCLKCHKFYDSKKVFLSKGIPRCDCGGLIKPDVVLYEEPLKEQDVKKAIDLIRNAEVLIIGGTSLNVYPAASFISYFNGKHLIIINKDKTTMDNRCSLIFHDNIATVLEEVENKLKEEN